MNWGTLTAQSVKQELSSQESTALETSEGTTDLQMICLRVSALIRGAVESGGGALGSIDGTIPDMCMADAIAITRWKWLLTLPFNEGMQTDNRKQEHDDAMDRVEQIARGEITLPAPEGVTTSIIGKWGSQEQLAMRTDDVTDDNT